MVKITNLHSLAAPLNQCLFILSKDVERHNKIITGFPLFFRGH